MEDFDMKLTQKLAKQYQHSGKKIKGQIISEYCQLTDVSRNTASKRFHRQVIRSIYSRVLPSTKHNRKGPKKKFRAVHVRIVEECWKLGGNICAERLHPMLCTYIDQLEIRARLGAYSRKDIEIAKSISLATLKRVISTFVPRSIKATL